MTTNFHSLHCVWTPSIFYFDQRIFFMQRINTSGVCNPSRSAFRTAGVAIDRQVSTSKADEVTWLKRELARVKYELKELKYATQQFVRSCI
jgi:hypothetical protein